MINLTKYFWAYVFAIMGMILLIFVDNYPILYGFFGGRFIAIGLRLAREYGEQTRS